MGMPHHMSCPLITLLTPQFIAALFDMDSKPILSLSGTNTGQNPSPHPAAMDSKPISALSGTTAGYGPSPPLSAGVDMNIWSLAICAPAGYQYGQPLTPAAWSPAPVEYLAAQRGPAVADISNMGDIRGKSVP
jgi:hypothetical protein